MSDMTLNIRQRRFVEEYFRTSPIGNATQAAIAAGYSPRSAKQTASRMMTNHDLQEALRARGKEILEELRTDQLKIAQKMLECVFYDITQLFDENGRLITDMSKLPPEIKSAIQSVEVVRQRRHGEWDDENQPIYDDLYKIRMTDKLKGLELIGRFQGMFKDSLTMPGLENCGSIRLPAMVEEGAPVPDFDADRK